MSRNNQSSHSGYFADYHNVRAGVAALRDVDGLRPDEEAKWGSIATTPERERDLTSQRLASLQSAENRLAALQGRHPERVYGIRLEDTQCGFYVSHDVHEKTGSQRVIYPRGIYVNTNPALFDNRAESVNTVVHEGRHAYQTHAVDHPGFHPQIDKSQQHSGIDADSHQDVRRWKDNDPRTGRLEQFFTGHGYKSAEKYGEDAYMRQPVERDAGEFGYAVTQGLYPNYQPSRDRINQYNAQNARDKYGDMKLSEQSQHLAASDPAHFRMHHGNVPLQGQSALRQDAGSASQRDLNEQLGNLRKANQTAGGPGEAKSPSGSKQESPVLKEWAKRDDLKNRLDEVRYEKKRLAKESQSLQSEANAMEREKKYISESRSVSNDDLVRLGDMRNRKLQIDYDQKQIDGQLRQLTKEEINLEGRYQASAQKERLIVADIERANAQPNPPPPPNGGPAQKASSERGADKQSQSQTQPQNGQKSEGTQTQQNAKGAQNTSSSAQRQSASTRQTNASAGKTSVPSSSSGPSNTARSSGPKTSGPAGGGARGPSGPSMSAGSAGRTRR